MSSRLGYLDGLRGVAAILVVVAHYATGFEPVLTPAGQFHSAVLAGLSNVTRFGPLAVSIFFLISGTVLTYAFRGQATKIANQTARRATRLGLPAMASIFLGYIWFFAAGNTHVIAARLMGGNEWLAITSDVSLALSALANDAFLGSMLFGHLGATLLPREGVRVLGLLSIENSFNPPVWTMHIEFYGSLLVLFIVRAENWLPKFLQVGLCVALAGVFICHPFSLFIFGYAGANMLDGKNWAGFIKPRWFQAIAAAGLAAGFAVALFHVLPLRVISLAQSFTDIVRIPMGLYHGMVYEQLGAILIYFSVLILTPARNMLNRGICQTLGKYSFSLYLVHFPILFTVTIAVYVKLQPFSPIVAMFAGSAAGLLLTFSGAVLFQRFIDEPSIRVSRRFQNR